MKLKISRVSLIGDREQNEDFAASRETGGGAVLVVADGLGGHAHGEWASRSVAEAMLESTSQLLAADFCSLNGARDQFARLFAHGREALRAIVAQRDAEADPQTTAAVAVLTPATLALAHIGDSRVYRLSATAIQWRSRDHSMVEMLVDQGAILEEEMGTHPDQGKLFKSIGKNRNDTPSVTVQAPLRPGELLLLCTDGFWEHITRAELLALAKARNLDARLNELAEAAVARSEGTSDNVTALCVRVKRGRGAARLKGLLG
jgi:serine/threonine protein phosphatase PrpC